MRPRRQKARLPLTATQIAACAFSLLTAACTLPDIRLDKHTKQTGNGVASLTDNSSYDRRYLASVHVRFSESKDATPVTFDINRDRRRLIAARLWVSEETSAIVNMGYNSDGPALGFRFNWHF